MIFKLIRLALKLFKMRALALMIILLAIPFALFALSPPSLRCISVLPNGEVELNWVVDPDTGSVFGGYHISFSNNPGGPFIALDSIFTYATTSYIHTGVNANNNTFYYYITSRDGCCSNYSQPSATLRTMRMIITPLSNEVVRLNWNRISTPPLPTTAPLHNLQKDIPGPGFSTFISLADTFTTDTNYFCDQFINFRVAIDDASGCQSVSSIDGEDFRDTQGPSQPVLDTVSVDSATGQATVSWFPDTTLDSQGYVIYQYNGVSYDSIGTVFGAGSTFFQFALSNADNTIETFSVAAFDSCRNLSSLAINHNSILVNGVFDKCESSMELSWNAYNNMNGLNRYEIWYRINGGTWIRDALVPPNILNHSLALTQSGAQYDVYIRAVGVLGTSSSSNIITFTAELFNDPDFIYIRTASVSGSAVNVLAHVDNTADVKSYRLYRSENGTTGYQFIDEKPFTPSTTVSFTDFSADPDIRSYYYRMTATDSCGGETFSDNVARTIHLQVENNEGQANLLTWNDYEGWPGPTGIFNIYRVVNGIIQIPQIANVNNSVLTYNEDVSSIGQVLDEYCYVIEALEEQVNSYGFIDSSFSNVACAVQEPYVFIPNAFTPGGKNPVFRPVIVFGDPATYDLRVYNRWGQLVFESDQPTTGWDGTYDGELSPAGMYVYQLIFKGFNQQEILRTGTVLLLK
jgi:gliding motility-associated-like protein